VRAHGVAIPSFIPEMEADDFVHDLVGMAD
jgi:hypothetical protein